MDFELVPLGPLVSLVVIIDIATQSALGGLSDDQPRIGTDAY
jgi:hypothetical protein